MIGSPLQILLLQPGNLLTQLSHGRPSAPEFRFLFSARRLHGDCEDICQKLYQEDIQACVQVLVPDKKLELCRRDDRTGKTVCKDYVVKEIVVEESRPDDFALHICKNKCGTCKKNLSNCLDDCKLARP